VGVEIVNRRAVSPPPTLQNPVQSVVDEVASWRAWSPPSIGTLQTNRVDGVDLLGEHERALHLDGEIHLAISPDLKKNAVAEGVAQPFRLPGWVEAQVGNVVPPQQLHFSAQL
jgi:hypothetical protein